MNLEPIWYPEKENILEAELYKTEKMFPEKEKMKNNSKCTADLKASTS